MNCKNHVPVNYFILLLASLILSFFVFSVRLFRLQILEKEHFSSKTNRIITRQETLFPERGGIFDRNYRETFAFNSEIHKIMVDRQLFDESAKYSVFNLLSKGIGIPASDLISLYQKQQKKEEDLIELVPDASVAQITFLAEHADELPGVYYETQSRRRYPTGIPSLCHLLGYTGKITPYDFKMLAASGYTRDSWIGKQGMEKVYDYQMRGTPGIRQRTVNNQEKTVTQAKVIQEPIPGWDLVLTIDADLQRLCEEALGRRSGVALVMRPSNGEILAMVSYPYYDNNFNTQPGGSQKYVEYATNSRAPLINRAIQSNYAPASTFKMIMSAAILETGLLGEEETVFCPGYKRIGRNHYFHCHKRSGHGKMDLPHAFSESCNVYYYTAGFDYLGKKGPELIKKYANDFGYGSVTGVDLPGEVAGLIPDTQWLAEKKNAHWVGGDTVNMSIGQGYVLTTPLQVACAVSMICNEGTIYRPHLMKEFRDPTTKKQVEAATPQIIHRVHYHDDTFKKIQHYMRMVCTVGTARYVISTKATEVAGKTGTAEVGRDDSWHSWFVAFAPYGAPAEEQIVVVVLVEADNEYEFWSAKASNIILQGYFAHQNYQQALKSLGWSYYANQEP